MTVQLDITFETLVRLIDQLPVQQQRDLVRHLQARVDPQTMSAEDATHRTPDLHPGGWMSEDFDDPLLDE